MIVSLVIETNNNANAAKITRDNVSMLGGDCIDAKMSPQLPVRTCIVILSLKFSPLSYLV